MATYSAVSAGEKDADSPITVSLIDKLDQNPLAMFEGAAGAPKLSAAAISDGTLPAGKISTGTITDQQVANNTLTQGTIADNAIGQGELKTAQGEASVNAGSTTNNDAVLTLPGGQYGFYPQMRSSSPTKYPTFNLSSGAVFQSLSASYSTSFVTYVTLDNSLSGSSSAYIQQRYIQASPPYKIQSVDFGPFIYVLLNEQGKVLSTWQAIDPPWWLLAPTTERKVRQPDGTIKKFYTEFAAFDKSQLKTNLKAYKAHFKKCCEERKEIKRLKQRESHLLNSVLKSKLTDEERQAAQDEIQSINAQLSTFEVQEKEITTETKNLRMNDLPHPFMSKKPTDRVCILSPLESDYDFVSDLLENGESVGELLNEGYIKIDQETDLMAPNGCKIHRFSFK